MDSEQERNEHFKGFAERLWDKLHSLYLHETGKETYEQMDKQIIAQYAYDLAWHIFASVPASLQAELGDPDNCVKAVPDFNKTVPDLPERFSVE